MPIIVPMNENQGDDGQRPLSLAEKRRRDLEAAMSMLDLDEGHRRNIDDAAAKRAYVAYSDQAASLLHGDDGLMYHDGADAHAAFPATAAGLADAHDQAITPLTPTQRGIVAAALGDRLKQDLALAGAHVREQGAIEQRRQSLALQQVAARDAVAHADDPALHDHYLATGENAIRQQATIDNLAGDDINRRLADYRSAVHADTIQALSRYSPVAAADWYGRSGGNLNGPDHDRVVATLNRAATPGGAGFDESAAARSADGGNEGQPSRMKVFTLTPPTPAPAPAHAGKPLTAREQAFLENNYAAASAVARKLHVDVNLLLGVSAFESKWSTSRQFRDQKNPFGATPDGSTPVTYPSIAAAWEKWGEQWGPRVVGVGNDADLFTTRLQTDNRKAVGAVDQRGKYNSATPAAWKKAVMDTIASVRRRTARWDAAAE